VLQLYEAGCEKLVEAVNTIAAGNELNCVPQIAGGDYYSYPTEEELSNFAHKGLSLVKSDEILSIARQFLTRY
jgi:methionyl-tRNA formyltransferase